jgi:hypothetical protein
MSQELVLSSQLQEFEVIKNDIASLSDNKPFIMSTLPMVSTEDKMRAFGYLVDSDFKLEERINMDIKVCDFIIEPLLVTNDETGEKEAAPHVVLIDTEGNSYTATSIGVYNTIKQIIGLVGLPSTWENGYLTMKAIKKETRNGNNKVTLLKPIFDTKKKK